MYNINRRKFLGLFGCSCCSLILPSCATVPITDRRQLSIIPEYKINQQAAAAYEQIMSADKEHVPAMTLLAQVYLSQQRPQEAAPSEATRVVRSAGLAPQVVGSDPSSVTICTAGASKQAGGDRQPWRSSMALVVGRDILRRELGKRACAESMLVETLIIVVLAIQMTLSWLKQKSALRDR